MELAEVWPAGPKSHWNTWWKMLEQSLPSVRVEDQKKLVSEELSPSRQLLHLLNLYRNRHIVRIDTQIASQRVRRISNWDGLLVVLRDQIMVYSPGRSPESIIHR